MLTITDVHKTFPQSDGSPLKVLEDINFSVKEGEFVSLLGPSGCGKSTLLNIIAGLENTTSGQVLIKGEKRDQEEFNPGMVFQKAALFPWLTVLDNVMFGLKEEDIPSDKAEKRALKYIKKVHLSKFTDAYPHQLSGGMKQRVAIARALALDSEVLLMDEPFGALDEQTRLLLQSELQKIWWESKKTVLFVTHSIREAVKLSDRVIVMGIQPGKIKKIFAVKTGRPRDRSSHYLVELENKILDILKEELKKKMKEETGDEYDLEADNFFHRSDHNLGSNI